MPTAKKLPPYCITAEKIPPYFGFTASAKVVTAKKEKTANRLKITAVWQYRRACVRLKNGTYGHPEKYDLDSRCSSLYAIIVCGILE